MTPPKPPSSPSTASLSGVARRWHSNAYFSLFSLLFFSTHRTDLSRFAGPFIASILLALRFRTAALRSFKEISGQCGAKLSACCLIIFCAYMVLYAASTSLPGLLQSLFGYDALNAGLVMSPAGFFAVVAMPVVGFVLGQGTDARWVIIAGLLIMAAGNYWMSQLNLEISPGQVVWPRVVLVLGLSICFAPVNVAAYLYTPPLLRGAAVGLLESAAQRGRQRGDVVGADNAGAP